MGDQIPCELNYPWGKTFHTWTICDWLQPKKVRWNLKKTAISIRKVRFLMWGPHSFSGTVIFVGGSLNSSNEAVINVQLMILPNRNGK